MFSCFDLGDGLYQNSQGELDVLLAPDSGLEIADNGENNTGLSVTQDNLVQGVKRYTVDWLIGSTFAGASPIYNPGLGLFKGTYRTVGEMVFFEIYIIIGATTNFSLTGIHFFSLPIASHADSSTVGTGEVYNGVLAATNMYFARTHPTHPNSVVLCTEGDTLVSTSYPTASWFAGDAVRIAGKYRMA